MNINNLQKKFSINEWVSYNNPLLKSFINAHFNSSKKIQYKLFHSYIFDFTKIKAIFNEYIEKDYDYISFNNVFNKNNTINFKNSFVKRWFNDWRVTYIGLTKTKSKGYLPLFLYLSEDNFTYMITGFCIRENEEKDIKKFKQIKNKYIYVEQDNYRKENMTSSLYDNIKEMSQLTKQYN